MTDNPAATNDVAVSLRARINTSQPHTARIWNYWLGGKDNYEVDRAAGDQIRQLHPGIGEYARADRLFLGRAVRHLVEEAGIRQFLDVGTGLPTADNTHEVAQRIAPDSRIVYVDNDPLVLAHARALLTSTPEGRTDYLDEDLRNVDAILEHASKTLDFSEPVALILLGVVIFIGEDDEAYGLVRTLMDRLPAGSHLVLSHTVTHPSMPDVDEAVKFWNEHGTPKLTQRTPADVARFFDGFQLLEPGVVSCSRWRPEHDNGAEPEEVAMFGGVARKD
ncbi:MULTISPECIES: SAM-dependent methyltransferase [Streptomyces]|uniref:O-methyltransferase involved in polyketide biosynthesis n=1 Tax=Streptomyces murinus TaxID=33900 RepID=A0A7W3RQ70_STRMR|nr:MULTISPECIES: SAM-dependent methyltransferase [Streptomyces]NDK27846.1 SAM-dependent methyltransferase [Streptomyces sp. TR1341]MBA9057976.1 O-methyltransferase involved in polyketide biosynthesis [Streptomyces murinus]UWW92200.1 SAM-dependent methyltransferase [Streptomyces murinus]WSI89511.1 SAM-dependent methyltransferase [Streptomyces murinus]WUD11173.1 SAM-dependent methyltransferase [Streptomyces murinus]